MITLKICLLCHPKVALLDSDTLLDYILLTLVLIQIDCDPGSITGYRLTISNIKCNNVCFGPLSDSLSHKK